MSIARITLPEFPEVEIHDGWGWAHKTNDEKAGGGDGQMLRIREIYCEQSFACDLRSIARKVRERLLGAVRK